MQKTSKNTTKIPSIIGSGLCAYAAKSIWSEASVYSPVGVKKHDVVNSRWRSDAIVSNQGWKGLSKYYHGVMPSQIIAIEEYREALNVLGIYHEVKLDNYDYYFVPRFTPRSKIKKIHNVCDSYKGDLQNDLTYVCLSVVGNINFLIDHGFLKEAVITDDIVFKLGKVSVKDFERIMPSCKFNKMGCHFPCLNFPSGQISFRPVFNKEVNINFIDVKENFRSDISMGDLFEKLRRSIYLRYGFAPGKVRYWECYVQKNISNAYLCSGNGITESLDQEKEFNLCIEELCDRVISAGFKSFNKNIAGLLSGIHLGYDREMLGKLPSNLKIFDTSLNPLPGQHPSIRAFCESYNIAANDYSSLKNSVNT